MMAKLDTRAFDAAFRRYIGVSRRSLAEVCNKKAFSVAVAALKRTPVGNRAEVESLGVAGYTVLSKTGKALKARKPIYSMARRMRDIYVGRHVARHGSASGLDFPVTDKALDIVKARLRALTFMRAGWLPAVRKLAPVAKESAGAVDARRKGAPKGYAVPAREGWNPVATIVNTATATKSGPLGPKAMAGLHRALQDALAAEAASMEQYVERKLREAAGR